MRRTRNVATACLGFALLAGCYVGAATGTDGNGNGGGATADGGTATGSDNGLPCDVAAVFAKYCTSCHGTTPSGNAPMSLVSYADLTRPSLSDPTQTNAQRSVARMRGTPSQMPPSPSTSVAAADIATVDSWVASGTPTGSCGADGGADPFGGPSVCTSGGHWTGGNRESSSMHPGVDCLSCHGAGGIASGENALSIGGTVYSTGHDPNDCNGANGTTAGLGVVIVDANNVTWPTLSVNAVGNFYMFAADGVPATPFGAKVVSTNGERAMVQHQTNGSCNSCHTVAGANGAPGRIVAP